MVKAAIAHAAFNAAIAFKVGLVLRAIAPMR
jgi:hypothetical protein